VGLADRIAAELTPVKPKFDTWVDNLPEVDRNALLAAAADPTITNASLLRVVRAEGAAVGHEKFTEWRHRNGNR
jgi:hypothetical protein